MIAVLHDLKVLINICKLIIIFNVYNSKLI